MGIITFCGRHHDTSDHPLTWKYTMPAKGEVDQGDGRNNTDGRVTRVAYD